MSADDLDLRRKIQQSESKRAELVIENHRLKDEIDQMRAAASIATAQRMSSSSPSRYAMVGSGSPQEAWTPGGASLAGLFASPIHESASIPENRRVEALEAQLREKAEQLDAAQRLLGQYHKNRQSGDASQHHEGGVGFVTIAPLPQPSEDDYGFAEEDHAKQCAEEIMARLLRALHTQREAQEKLASAQLANVRLQSLLDESRGREVVLSQMMGAYSEVVNSSGGSRMHTDIPASGRGRGGNNPSGAVGPQQVEEYLQQCVHNLTRLDGVKRRLVDEKLKEVTEECARLKEALAAAADRGVHSPSRHSSPLPANDLKRKAMDGPSMQRPDVPLLSDERALLLQLMDRETEYQNRMMKLKHMIIEKEKQNQDLKKLLAVSAGNGSQKRLQ